MVLKVKYLRQHLEFEKVKIVTAWNLDVDCHYVINEYKASGYTIYLLVNMILKVMVHLQMLYSHIDLFEYFDDVK